MPSTYSGAAFNCGRSCRIASTGSNLTVEDAQLGDASPAPKVAFVLDGASHAVADSLNRGNSIETVCRWEGSTLRITGKSYGRPIAQTISLDQNELVVVTTSGSNPAARLTLRYTKKPQAR